MGEHVHAAPPPPGPEPVDQLLHEGSASYLDALYALHRFKREVIDAAMEVWRERVTELAVVIGMEPPRVEDVERYCNPDGVNSRDCDGNWAWITCKSWFAAPLNAVCHLGLCFEREQNGGNTSCNVTFAIGPRPQGRLDLLTGIFEGAEHFWRDDAECGFSWPLENIDGLTRADLVGQFRCMMKYVIGLAAWHDLPH